MSKIAVYPGSFDPVTEGHLDILKRTSKLFSKVIMAVVVNYSKNSLFTVEERIEILRNSIKLDNVEFDSFEGLLVDYVRQRKGDVIIRGLRATTDFEYEFQMAHTNKKLAPDIETMFIAADNRYTFVSSNTIKEVARLGGDITGLVPESALNGLKNKFNK